MRGPRGGAAYARPRRPASTARRLVRRECRPDNDGERTLASLPASRRIGIPTRALCVLPLAVIALLAWRVTLGVDLSDESYYLSFVDGWLKTGLRDSRVMVVHQTAALPVYPFGALYAWLRGDTEGLALLLRALYLSAACIAGLSFHALARATHGRTVAAFAFVLAVSFVPFSLPAPSYNTLGLFGLIAALSTCGVYLKTGTPVWAALSAFAWSIATLAYPTLLVVLAALLTGLLSLRRLAPAAWAWRYAGFCLILQAAGLALVSGVFGVEHLGSVLAFTNASLNVSDGLGARLARSAGMIAAKPLFLALCAAAAVIGAIRARAAETAMADWLLVAAVWSLLAGSCEIGPVLYARTHDYVFLLGLTAAAFSVTPKAGQSSRIDPILAGGLGLGLLAGAATSLTATNGLVNFAVGGFCAAAWFLLAVVPAARHRTGRLQGSRVAAHGALLGGVSCFFLHGAFSFVYGEQQDVFADSRRVRGGVFAGLLTSRDKAEAIEATSRFLAGLPGESIAALGRLPGIYLLTDKAPRTPSTWDFGQQHGSQPAMEQAIGAFYAAPSNRPDVFLVVSDPWTRPPSAAGLALLSRYRPLSRLTTGAWTIEAYGR